MWTTYDVVDQTDNGKGANTCAGSAPQADRAMLWTRCGVLNVSAAMRGS
jgi:hypothetical protein